MITDKMRTMSAEKELEPELESESKLELDTKKSQKKSENTFYWLKLHKDFLRRRDVRIIKSRVNGKEMILLYLELLLDSLENDGRVMLSHSIPCNIETIASTTDTPIELVKTALLMFEQMGWIKALDDGTFYMTELHLMTGYERKENKERSERRKRAKQRSEQSMKATLDDATERELHSIISNYTQNDELRELLKRYVEMQFLCYNGMKAARLAEQLFKLTEYSFDDDKGGDDEKVYIVKVATEKKLKGFFKLSKEEKRAIMMARNARRCSANTDPKPSANPDDYYDWIEKIKKELEG